MTPRSILAAFSVACTLGLTAAVSAPAALAAAPEAPEILAPVGQVFATTATLKGIVDPNATAPGEGGTYQFVYKASKTKECKGAGDVLAPAEPGGYGGGEHEEVPAQPITGLTASTEYAACLIATNSEATPLSATSPAVTFKTKAAVAPEVPVATPVAGRSASSAVLQGTLNPNAEGEPGSYQFIYRQNATECKGAGEQLTAKEPSNGGAAEEVGAQIEGLESGKQYSYCLRAYNALGTSTLSTPRTFTAAIPPEAPVGVNYLTGSATATTAELEGTLNPLKAGEAGTYEFIFQAYPLTAPPNTSCNEASAPNPGAPMTGAKEQRVATELTGLQPHARYTFCLRVHNEAGEEANAGDGSSPEVPLVTFETKPAPPSIDAQGSSIGADGVHLEAQINPNNEATQYRFEYSSSKEALENAEGTSIAAVTALPALYGDQPASVSPGVVLAASSTYYYRAFAENEQSRGEGTPATGEIQELTTPPAPLATTGEAGSVGSESALLTGTLDPEGAPTTYVFQYLTREAYERAASDGDVEEQADPYIAGESTASLTLTEEGSTNPYTGTEAQTLPLARAAGLLPDTTYYYRVSALNPFGEVDGAQGSFTTLEGEPAPAPPVEPAPPTYTPVPLTVPGSPATLGFPAIAFPTEAGTVPGPPKPLTNKQKLAKALTACHKDKKKPKRQACERTARKKYGPKKKSAKK